mgnify:CR=1 FL=1
MELTCVIVEDQPPAQRVLEKYIKDLGALKLLGVFSDALAALEFLKRENLKVILTGKRRNYIINEFNKNSIKYKYFVT